MVAAVVDHKGIAVVVVVALLLMLVLRALDVLVARAQRQTGDDEQDGKDRDAHVCHAVTRPAARPECITPSG